MSASPRLSPERLARLLDGAVSQVTPAPGTLDRIYLGIRRRRRMRRAGAALLSAAVLAGGGVTVLAVASGTGPAATMLAGQQPGSKPLSGTDRVARLAPASYPVHMAMPAPQDEPDMIQAVDSDHVTHTGPAGLLATATIVPQGPAATTDSFRLVVRLTTGAAQTIRFTATSAQDMPPLGPVVIGWTDASGIGSREIFVQVSKGSSTTSWAIFRLVNGRLKQITMAGRPALLTVGGGPAAGGGFSCPGEHLVVYGYHARGAAAFAATIDTYRWAGARLVLTSHRQTTIYGTVQNPQLDRYQTVSCGGLDPSRSGGRVPTD